MLKTWERIDGVFMVELREPGHTYSFMPSNEISMERAAGRRTLE